MSERIRAMSIVDQIRWCDEITTTINALCERVAKLEQPKAFDTEANQALAASVVAEGQKLVERVAELETRQRADRGHLTALFDRVQALEQARKAEAEAEVFPKIQAPCDECRYCSDGGCLSEVICSAAELVRDGKPWLPTDRPAGWEKIDYEPKEADSPCQDCSFVSCRAMEACNAWHCWCANKPWLPNDRHLGWDRKLREPKQEKPADDQDPCGSCRKRPCFEHCIKEQQWLARHPGVKPIPRDDDPDPCVGCLHESHCQFHGRCGTKVDWLDKCKPEPVEFQVGDIVIECVKRDVVPVARFCSMLDKDPLLSRVEWLANGVTEIMSIHRLRLYTPADGQIRGGRLVEGQGK